MSPEPKRKRGRPRLDIDTDAIADAVAELFAEGGIDAVSILDAAEKLNVSRATLYRTVPTKQDLLGILLERSTAELTAVTQVMLDQTPDPAERLSELVRLQVDAAVRMRSYLPVFFGGGDLPPDVFQRWRKWSRDYEAMWVDAVRLCMEEGILPAGDPLITARLMLGSCLWISRWYRPQEEISPEQIAETALALVEGVLGTGHSSRQPTRSGPPR